MRNYTNFYVIQAAIIASMAGLLFGLDEGYVNGSISLIQSYFHISLSQTQSMAQVMLIGAAIGALLGGILSKYLGRKITLVLSSVIFVSFTILGIFAPTYDFLLCTRFFIGIAVGISSFVAPIYLAEIAPARMRGTLTALFQLMVVTGLSGIYISNYLLSGYDSWRIMLVVILIPSTLMLIGTLTLPRSPRWLYMQRRYSETIGTLKNIRADEQTALAEYDIIQKSQDIQSSNKFQWAFLKKGFFIKLVILGVTLQMLQQLTGENAFAFYSSEIFKQAGFSNPQLATIAFGIFHLIFTFLGIWLIDIVGRRKILYLSLSLMLIALISAGLLLNVDQLSVHIKGDVLLLCIIVFNLGFSIGMGPVVWVLCAEIFPLATKDFAVTLTTFSNWMFNSIIGGYTLSVITTVGMSGTFFIFAAFCIISLFVVKLYVPETRGVQLETIEINSLHNLPLRKLGA